MKLIGDFNVYNVSAVYGAAIELGMTADEALQGISTLNPINGRFQKIEGPKGITGIIDYAHTPDALKKILSSLQKFRKPPQRIITIIGCGGDRDKGKRKEMAIIAKKHANRVYLTDDNPRNESPENIRKTLKKYCLKGIEISDRRMAIKTAILELKKNEVLIIAGKGHEKYQIIKNKKIKFDDYKIAKSFIK
jgi:UDP-N-acetylmuramoyl-L-alanyl-D-glutamate--2,6-diaminopimelate ligase